MKTRFLALWSVAVFATGAAFVTYLALRRFSQPSSRASLARRSASGLPPATRIVSTSAGNSASATEPPSSNPELQVIVPPSGDARMTV